MFATDLRPAPTPRAWQAGALAAAGIAAVSIVCLAMPGQNTLLRTLLALAGAALLVAALARASRAVLGTRVAPATAISTLWLGLLAAAAVLADVVPLAEHRDQTTTILDPGFAPPDLFSRHPLGTNSFALDLLARSIYGARVSLLNAGLAVAVSLLVGGLIGVLAGFERGRFDRAVSVLTDSLLAFPAILLLIAVAAITGRPTSVAQAVLKNGLALALVGIPTIIRLARAHTIRYAHADFVSASRVMGARPWRIIRRDIVPNVAPPLASFGFVMLAVLIVADGSLAFIGLGLSQPEPTWGNMIAEAQLSDLRDHPFIVLVPGAFMFLTVLCLNQLGETLDARWSSPDSRRRRLGPAARSPRTDPSPAVTSGGHP